MEQKVNGGLLVETLSEWVGRMTSLLRFANSEK